jgi:hypothetical protein
MPLLSKDAISNFPSLGTTSYCDNVLLEYKLAFEFKERGYIDYVFPVMIGDIRVADNGDEEYGNYFADGCHPRLSPGADITITPASVVTKISEHLDRLSLGMMMQDDHHWSTVLSMITANQGHFIQGAKQQAFDALVPKVQSMVKQKASSASSVVKTGDFFSDLLIRLNDFWSKNSQGMDSTFQGQFDGIVSIIHLILDNAANPQQQQ